MRTVKYQRLARCIPLLAKALSEKGNVVTTTLCRPLRQLSKRPTVLGPFFQGCNVLCSLIFGGCRAPTKLVRFARE